MSGDLRTFVYTMVLIVLLALTGGAYNWIKLCPRVKSYSLATKPNMFKISVFLVT